MGEHIRVANDFLKEQAGQEKVAERLLDKRLDLLFKGYKWRKVGQECSVSGVVGGGLLVRFESKLPHFSPL